MFRGKFLAISSRVFPLSLSLSLIFCIACSLLCEACKLAASCFFVVLRFLFFLSRDCCAKTDQAWFADRFCPRGMECCSGGVFVSAILFPIFLEYLSGVVKEDCSWTGGTWFVFSPASHVPALCFVLNSLSRV
jgi:hypothetical protein